MFMVRENCLVVGKEDIQDGGSRMIIISSVADNRRRGSFLFLSERSFALVQLSFQSSWRQTIYSNKWKSSRRATRCRQEDLQRNPSKSSITSSHHKTMHVNTALSEDMVGSRTGRTLLSPGAKQASTGSPLSVYWEIAQCFCHNGGADSQRIHEKHHQLGELGSWGWLSSVMKHRWFVHCGPRALVSLSETHAYSHYSNTSCPKRKSRYSRVVEWQQPRSRS